MRHHLLALHLLSLLLAACGDPDKPDDTGQETGDDSPVETSTWYADDDGDGYGDPAVSQEAASQPSGFVDNADDCDDGDAAVNPGAAERCDGVDNDCDGAIDGEAAVDRLSCHRDADGDGYGDPASLVEDCTCAEGWVENAEDCDDACDLCWTGALEVCEDGFDNDCDGWDDRCLLDGDYLMAEADATILGEEEEGLLGYEAQLSDDLTGDGMADILLEGWTNEVYIVSGELSGSSDISDVAVATISGDASVGEWLAYSSPIGDIDGDGYRDLSLYASHDKTVRVFLGPIIGALSITEHDYAIASGETAGLETKAYMGFHTGDLDGDGSDDLLLAASSTQPDTWHDGGVALFYGPITVDTSLAAADVFWSSGESEQKLGSSVSTGDLDGDGIMDAVIGAPSYWELSANSRAYVLYGPLTAGGDLGGSAGVEDAYLAGERQDWTGAALAASSDLDGDGLADIVISASHISAEHLLPEGAGAVYVLYGTVSGQVELLEQADAMICGTSSGDGLGGDLDVGDIDGDGLGDLAARAGEVSSGPADAGAIHIFYDAPSGILSSTDADVVLSGNAEDDYAIALSTAADVDGDGFADILVGAWGDDSNASKAGAAYLFYGGGG